jgi:NAD(P)-dependent dehydrogenase (short-subunit alcohol dehydrogenase family)
MIEFGDSELTTFAKLQEPNRQRLIGQVAVVTGASRGLGQFFAKVLAREGAHVVLAARSQSVLKELADKIASSGGKAYPVGLDVRRTEMVEHAFEEIITRCGVPTVLINNAGIAEMSGTLEQTAENFDNILCTNLRGPWLVAREAAKHMVAQKIAGSIVNIASILGIRQGGQVTAYGMTKAALIQMTKQLALEWARHGIRVNALAPGYVETELNREFFASEKGRAMIRRIPMRRLVRMEDLIEPLMLLAGAGGAFMTGSVLPVDGGHLISTL